MRVIRAASAALLGAAALALSATAASAAPGGGDTAHFAFSVTPSTIAAGGRVTLSVTGCTRSATASSAVFDTTTVPRNGTAVATVDADAKRGATYRVTFRCDGRTGTANLTIASGSATPRPTVPGAVNGGLGGSVGGVDAAELAAGGAMVLAAAGGTVYAARRRTPGSH
jgi:hypothetical protein